MGPGQISLRPHEPTDLPQMVVKSKGNPLNSGKSRLVKYSQVVSTHLWEHTPSNLYQRAFERDSFHGWRTGDCLGCVETVMEILFHLPRWVELLHHSPTHPPISLLGTDG